jgi:HAD superfamily hydrolase (TIGR01549 family)
LGTVKVVLTDFERTLVRLFEDRKVEKKFFQEVWDNCVGRDVPIKVLNTAGESPYSLWMKAYRWMNHADKIQAEMLHHALSKIATRYEMSAVESVRFFDDVQPVLERLKIAGIPVVIVSNNATAAVEKVLEKNDVKRLADYVIGREYIHQMAGNLKPKPNLLLKALQRSGHDASTALLVGDSVDDMRAGRAANIRLRVGLLQHSTATKWQLRRAGAKWILRRFGDLPTLPDLQPLLHRADAPGDR